MPNLLYEIGTEELPAGYIRPALKQMETLLGNILNEARVSFKQIYTAGTPRRLTIFAETIDDKQTSIEEEVLGPSCKVAFDADNNPTNAGKGFAKSQGVDFKELKIKETKKGKYCYVIKKQEGKQTIELLPEMLTRLIKSIDFPKKMIWKGKDFAFARPVRSLTALFDTELVNLELNGIKSNRTVMGNPYISSPETYGIGKPINLDSADFNTYKQKLLNENVIVDIDERKTILKGKASKILAKYNAHFSDDNLLEELTNLVEYPTAIECCFEETFLDLPDKVIIAAMKGHQRYCPVIDQNEKLHNKFVSVVNMPEKGAEKVREGNERVLRARLTDARFFLDEDKKIPISDRVESLKGMTFHRKMGSYLDRTERIVNMSTFIAQEAECSDSLVEDIKRAAYLCKADLVTAMVGEFPELQGIMGREYASYNGESNNVAIAIEEHYLPRFANDRLPETDVGTIVSLADKFDMISGCFSVGLIPTGSRDPFALRRNVQAIIRIIEKRGLNISIRKIFNHALTLFPEQKAENSEQKTDSRKGKRNSSNSNQQLENEPDYVLNQILEFFKDRLYQTFIDRDYRYDVINAAIASGYENIFDLTQRLQTISAMLNEDFWQDLVTIVERTFNISKKQNVDVELNENLLVEAEEKTLWKAYFENKDNINSLIDNKDFKQASIAFVETFTVPVHTFFDKVFVNVEDEKIKNNRLMLLKKINELYSTKIADLSKIVIT
ncbi:MAG: glycine--tRNA ligase subunit beta [Candidatus Anammoxibacter sp.]